MSKLQNILLIVILLTSFGPPAIAEQKNNTSSNSHISNKQSNISQQKAVDIAQQRINGRVLAINHTDDDTYRIKILSSEGSVHIVLISAIDGSVISVH
jgi:uncharacterized membrane protein YkoI